MYQKFFTNTLGSKYIKSLLYNTPLPIYDTVADGDYMVEGLTYIYKTSLIKCTRSGLLYNTYSTMGTASNKITASSSAFVGSTNVYGDYKVLQNYIFGKPYLKVTQNFKSNYRYYDSETHAQLGTYLRCIRDIYNIDLMPFYNCFTYQTINSLYLTDDMNTRGYIAKNNSNYKILCVPIKYNKTYTIAIDCATPVLMRPILWGAYGLIKDTNYQILSDYFVNEKFDKQEDEHTVTYYRQFKKYSNLNFSKPTTFTLTNNSDDAKLRLELYNKLNPQSAISINQDTILKNVRQYQELQKYLCLLIQIPANNNSSIVVIEGDYSNTTNVIPVQDITNAESPKVVNQLLISKLGLLQLNNRSIYAFSDRLLEYLLHNVIDYQDDITQNIIRAQTYAKLDKKTVEYGFFDVVTRAKLYEKYMSDESTKKLDINGFVDKDMEKFITRGYDV